jgi:hypothetical protein
MSKSWKGSFSSTYYNYFGINMVCGQVYVDLPEDITTTDTSANLKFTGIYRRGSESQLEFKYTYPTLIGKFKDSNQIIKFTPHQIRDDIISGTYESENPYDTGKFKLSLESNFASIVKY